MTIQAKPEELDQLMARISTTFTKRLLTVLEGVPMANDSDLLTDVASRRQLVTKLIAQAEKEHPLPDWREML